MGTLDNFSGWGLVIRQSCWTWLVIASLGLGCSQPPSPDVAIGHHIADHCPPKGGFDYYFPPASITDRAISGPWQRDEYTQLLELIDAEPLWCGDSAPAEVYRLIVLPPFRSPIVVTANLAAPGWTIETATYNVLSSTGSRASGVRRVAINQRTEGRATQAQLRAFVSALDRAQYWDARSYHQPQVEDATVWTIEARTNGKYGIVTRLVNYDHAFEEAARALLNLAELRLPEPK
jgi:hypothetical protein